MLLGFVLGAAGTAAAATVPDDFPTIQAAVDAVVSGGLPDGTTIDIRPGTFAEALTINATGKSLTLRALSGPGTVTVDATGKNRTAFLVLNATGTIRVQGLRFTGGRGDPSGGTGGGMTLEGSSPAFEDCVFEGNTSLLNGGAGVLTRSNATFLRCTFASNSAVQFGGGLVITTGSRPTFASCAFQGNIAGTGSAKGSGGAIHSNDASPTLRDCRVLGNQAKFAGGGIFHLGDFGSPNGVATLLIEESEVSGNTASRASPGSPPAEGGGIHIEDNALGRIVRSAVRNNAANTGGGLNAYRARYEIGSSVVEGNQAPDASNVGGFGGGIQASSNNTALPLRQASTVILNDTVVRNNTARIGGGIFVGGDQVCAGGACTDATATKASLSLTGSLVDGNTATKQAGGIYSTRSTVTVSGGLVSRNKNNAGDGYGGGLMLVSGTSATLTGARVAANEASQFGGGIFVDLNTTLSVTGSTIYRNTAGNTAGGLYVGSNGANGGIVQTSALVDNVGTTIAEQCPAPASAPYLTYSSNTIVGSGTATIYTGMCNPPGNLTVAGLNALPSGKASGNTGALSLATVQALAYFGATPDFFASTSAFPSVLAWSVMRATSVSIAPAVSPSPSGDTGSVDVTGAAIVNYSFSATTSLGGVGPLGATVSPRPGNTAPAPAISSPASGATFAVGQVLILTGSATDAEDGALGASRLSWTVVRQPGGVVVYGPVAGNGLAFTAPAPPSLAAAATNSLEVRLTATDSSGTSATVARAIQPRKVSLTFASNPSGVSLALNGSAVTTPSTVVSWEGYLLTATAPLSHGSGSTLRIFSSWGAVLSNTLTVGTPAAPATYTAIYQASVDLGPLDHYTIAPCRVLDTRWPAGPLGGPAMAAGSSRTFAAWGVCGIPATARALSVNVTVTGASNLGHIRLHPADQLVPPTSALNFRAGVTRANNAILALDPAGDFRVWCVMPSGSAQVIVDVTGYFE